MRSCSALEYKLKTVEVLDGYTAINESDEEAGGCRKKHAGPKSDQQNEGRVVSSARYTASAIANRSRPSEGRTYRTQDAKPDGCSQSEGRDVDGETQLDDWAIAGYRDPQASG